MRATHARGIGTEADCAHTPYSSVVFSERAGRFDRLKTLDSALVFAHRLLLSLTALNTQVTIAK
jgi:hypothetical protein